MAKQRPIIVDVESSGFGPYSYPIEIGVAFSQELRYCRLIRPEKDWTYWDEKAEAVHHITRNAIIEHGKSIFRIATELNELLKEHVVYSDGWVVDKPWINKLFHAAGISKTFLVSPLERILSENQMKIWHQTQKRIIENADLVRHRASADAFIIQETYMKTLEEDIE